MDNPTLLLRLKYLFTGSVLVTTTLLGITCYLVYSGDRMVTRHAPLVDAAMEIKLNATLGHLWFEEIVSGDRHEDIEEVWSYLEQADWYAEVMLVGGKNENGNFYSLTNEHMRSTIESVRVALQKFRNIALQRYDLANISHPGSDIDQKFDRLFVEFMQAADRVEALLRATISNELSGFRQTAALLIAFALLISIFVAVLLLRMERQRHLHLSTIFQAHAEIKQQHAEIKQQHAELNYLAHFDPLSDLPNRKLLLDRLKQAISHAKRKGAHVALLFIDLDKFKSVNDRLGHPAGDALLACTAERLRKSVRADDTVARLGGDEFTVVLSDIGSKEIALSAAKAVARKILRELSEPFVFNGATAFVSASIGVAVYPEDGKNVDELLSNADRAMFEVKNRGKNDFIFHSRDMNERAKKQLSMENDLRNAIKNDQLIVYYQPQWDIQKNRLAGFEAQVRWYHPRRGLISPIDFIPVAEATGLIEHIDIQVLTKACHQYREWKDEGLIPGKISVNLSAMLFRRPDLIGIISTSVAEACIEKGELEIELTESALLENTEHTQTLLKQLNKLGVQLAIDDFGTGYSSMAYLRNFPANTLKIDRSFIDAVGEDNSADAIVKSMVELARNLGMKVVAEGIETATQEKFLRAIGCDFGQGIKLSIPLTSDEARLLMISETENNVSIMTSKNSSN